MCTNKLNEIVFPESYPMLDLHGFDRNSAKVAINDFVHDCNIMGYEFIVIMHGNGTGALQKETADTLKENKDVLYFKRDNFNSGLTLVQLKKGEVV